MRRGAFADLPGEQVAGWRALWREAVELLALLQLQRPSDSTVRARTHLQLAIDRLVELYPQSFDAHYKLAMQLKRLGELAGSAEVLGRASALRPDDARAHYSLGVVRKVLGDLDGAIASYERAIELRPYYGLAHSPRYDAACCAILAATGRDKGTGGLDAAQQRRWRHRALGWLRAAVCSGGKWTRISRRYATPRRSPNWMPKKPRSGRRCGVRWRNCVRKASDIALAGKRRRTTRGPTPFRNRGSRRGLSNSP